MRALLTLLALLASHSSLLAGALAVPGSRWTSPKRASAGLRIAGGSAVPIETHPYQAAVEYAKRHSCGASIISESKMLSSASCLDFMSVPQVKVRVGSATLESGGLLLKAKTVWLHGEYKINALSNDVAVIGLNASVAYSPTVQPIALPAEGSEPEQGTRVLLLGWGGVNEDESDLDSPTLRAVWVSTISRLLCKMNYKGVVDIDDSIFCSSVSGKGTCGTDDGGPVVGEDGVQYGVASSVGTCGVTGFFDIHANLADKTVRDWIQIIMNKP